MRTNLIYSEKYDHPGYGAGEGTIERFEYECPCGNGKIIEEHDNIPGFREHDVYIRCERCSENYRIDKSNGTYTWELIQIS